MALMKSLKKNFKQLLHPDNNSLLSFSAWTVKWLVWTVSRPLFRSYTLRLFFVQSIVPPQKRTITIPRFYNFLNDKKLSEAILSREFDRSFPFKNRLPFFTKSLQCFYPVFRWDRYFIGFPLNLKSSMQISIQTVFNSKLGLLDRNRSIF